MFKNRERTTTFFALFAGFFILLSGLLFFVRFFDQVLKISVVIQSEEALRVSHDFDRTDPGITSTGDDPWVEIQVTPGTYASVEIDLKALNVDSTRAAVYYRLSGREEYSEERCVKAELTVGKKAIALPGAEIDCLRLDLTDEPGVYLEFGDVTVVPVISGFSIRSFFLLAMIILAVAVVAAVPAWVLSGCFPAVYAAVAGMIRHRPGIFLCSIMGFSILCCFWNFLFGVRFFSFVDIGSDTVYVYQPAWFSLVDDIAAGRVAMWSMNNGLGTSTLYQLSWAMDPFIWPVVGAYRLIGFDAAQIVIAWMQGLKLCCCALVCYGFLSEFSMGNAAKILSSYAYGLCGFVILWGQHYMFSTYFLAFSVVFMFLEKVLRREKWCLQHLFFILSVGWLFASTYYFTYMSLITMAVYTVFRLFTFYSVRDVRKWVFSGLKILGMVFFGLILSSAFFLPQVWALLTVSDRIQSGIPITDCLKFFANERIMTILLRTLSNNLIGIDAYGWTLNHYEAEQLFFTSFMPMFFFFYVSLGAGQGRKTILLRCAAVVALMMLPLTPLTGYVMNGFVKPFARYTFVLMPVYAVIAAKAMDGILERKISTLSIASVGVVYMAVLVLTWRRDGLKTDYLIPLLGEVVVLLMLILLYRRTGETAAKVLRIAMAVVILLNVLVDTWLTSNERKTLNELYSAQNISEMTDTVRQVQEDLKRNDPELFRMEKTWTDYSGFNDAMTEDYYGISSYNSTMNSGVKEFYKQCWREVDYVADGVYILFNLDYSNAKMAGLLGVKYLLSDQELLNHEDYSYLTSFRDKKIYLNDAFTGFGRFYSHVMSYAEFEAYTQQERQRLLQDHLVMAERTEDTVASGTVNVLQSPRDDLLEAVVSADGRGYVFFPIPYEDGWKATVNGKQQEIERVDYGFMAVAVEGGESRLILRYTIPLLREGIIISLSGLVVLFLTVWFIWFRRRKMSAVKTWRFDH